MKLFKILTLVTTLAGLTACGGRHFRDTALYHPSGRAKPTVAVLPVINSCTNTLSWDISHEMTEEIRKRVADSSRIYLLNAGSTLAQAVALNHPDLKKIASAPKDESLASAEFIVVSELIDQNETRKVFKDEKRSYLNESQGKISMAMRLRVIDMRGREPRVVLQEVVQNEQKIGKGYLHIDYAKTPWGSSGFENTPLGMAHSKMAKEIVSHIEGYIGL